MVPVPEDHPEAFVKLVIFDDDGPEGFYERLYFRSSWEAARHFVEKYSAVYHCNIDQINKKKEITPTTCDVTAVT